MADSKYANKLDSAAATELEDSSDVEDERKTFVLFSIFCGLAFFGFLLFFVAIGTNSWFKHQSGNTTDHHGLWKACFDVSVASMAFERCADLSLSSAPFNILLAQILMIVSGIFPAFGVLLLLYQRRYRNDASQISLAQPRQTPKRIALALLILGGLFVFTACTLLAITSSTANGEVIFITPEFNHFWLGPPYVNPRISPEQANEILERRFTKLLVPFVEEENGALNLTFYATVQTGNSVKHIVDVVTGEFFSPNLALEPTNKSFLLENLRYRPVTRTLEYSFTVAVLSGISFTGAGAVLLYSALILRESVF